jgi:putative chitinase
VPDTITQLQLAAFLPKLTMSAEWAEALNGAMDRFEINTPARAAAFLAQVAHESTELKDLVENLSYSAKGLVATWPKRFTSLDAAQPYERQPELLANYVYAKRLGNGDTASGDGWRYRGRGLLHVTGRGNYRSCGTALSLPLEEQPELLATPVPAALAAAQFWQSHGCNQLADDHNDDNDDEDFVSITSIVNGGTIGLKSRQQYWVRAQAAFGLAPRSTIAVT